MRFTTTPLSGVVIVDVTPREDERGLFARTWCRDEFSAAGIVAEWVQCNVSFNRRSGTLRGMHYQREPFEEVKLVRCTMGAAFDVILDIRRDSPTFQQWTSVVISAQNRRAVYIPAGCAHGFQTLVDSTELFYQMGAAYHADAASGVRWDDPAFDIKWPPCDLRTIAPRDLAFPDFAP